ncbi:MAG: peptide chain release factor N(5)-glutamine methyltransferase [Granulosicoccus sp.]|nr:peptide chain release factor N(5)-glutamine methyltransferase [Granulosicoccus sp.]
MTEPAPIRSVAGELAAATRQLSSSSDTARLDAEVLLACALKQDRSWLYAHSNDALDDQTTVAYQELIARRSLGEPVAYLTGEQEFWSLPLCVSPAVLIPRADTELLVELALQYQSGASQSVLELGTGTGAISIALSIEKPQLNIVATDCSKDALLIAGKNIDRHQCSNIRLVESDWYSALGNQQFDQLVSNPPYIADSDPHLQQGDLRAEPSIALRSGSDGMTAMKQIIGNASPYLRAGASILLEHGHDQAVLVQQLLQQNGYRSIKTYKDLGENDRVTCAQHP